MRIVSLIASATEIVCALGFEDQLVGRSHECDFPASVRRLPMCTEPKFAVDGSSAEIDRLVRETLQDSLSVYTVHEDQLRDLRPDVIVTQSHCDVCAVSERDVQSAVCNWLDNNPKIVSLTPNGMEDIWTGIRQVAEALDVAERGERLIADLKQRMADLSQRCRDLPHPTVASLEWIDPLMASGNWMPDLIAQAGGVNLFGTPGGHSGKMTWDSLRERDPEVIVVMPCGFDLERTRAEMPALVNRPGWFDLKAVQTDRVYLTDGNQYFNRPGPRLAESLEILAEILHPGSFAFGHEGAGWEQFTD